MKRITNLFLTAGLFVAAAGFVFTSCTKEGPQGTAGTNGKNGVDANETCKQCHAPSMVDRVAVEFQMSKHSYGVAEFEEAGNGACTSCHSEKGFIYVCQNNVPATFSLVNGKYVNNYTPDAANQFGAIGCWTCHSSLHTTYGIADLAFTTTSPVSMTMYAGLKEINIPSDSGVGNLCAKCHQPRPVTCGYDPAGRVLNYDSLVSHPDVVAYDSALGNGNHGVKPSYRLGVHYGTVGAIFAGVGGIELAPPGGVSYSNSKHTTVAACPDCHMASPMTGIAGGHSFSVRNSKETPLTSSTTFNFNGCNADSTCHAKEPITATSTYWATKRAGVKLLLDQLADKINGLGMGHNILHADATSANLWAGITTGNWDGYLDFYDASANPTGYWKLTSTPKFPTLTNAQLGAIINFQLCLREYSLGIHNNSYTTALLTNSIKSLP
ncbi:MAG: hypothetical protein NTW10_01410 [Bacteroidetes bacterium]|nr:hypothetical protein [Bacteroidota bacterium]